MRLPIPDDWDGETWDCVIIQWPSSSWWFAILLGFMTQPKRGRFWDERTGSISGVQEIGRAIFERNYPWVACGNDVPPIAGSEVLHVMSEWDFREDIAMSLCGYNPKAFRITDGVLEVRDFCGDWVQIGALQSKQEQPPPPADVWDQLPPSTVYSGCGKADAWVSALWSLGNAMWDNYEDVADYPRYLEEAVPTAQLSYWEIYPSIAQMIILDTAYEKSTFMDADVFQKMRCAGAKGMYDTPEATEDEMRFLSNAIEATINEEYDTVTAELVKGFFIRMGSIVGEQDATNIATLGALNLIADCACPSEPPEQGILYFTGGFSIPDETHGSIANVTVLSGGRRVLAQYNYMAGAFRTLSNLTLETNQPGDVINSITVRAYPQGFGGDFPYEEWYDEPGPYPSTEFSRLELVGVSNQDRVRTDQPGYTIQTITNVVGGITGVVIPSGRSFNLNSAPVSFYAILEITEINGQQFAPIGP